MMKKILGIFSLLLFAQMSFGAITVGYTSANGSDPTSTSVSTVAGSTTNGSTFIVGVASRGTTAPSSVVDSNSVSYTLAQGTTGYSGVWVYYCINCTGGASYTVTATFAATAVNNEIMLVEFKGVGAGTYDQAPTGTYNSTGGTGPQASPSITTTVANELVVDLMLGYGSNNQTYTDSGSGFSIALQANTFSTPNGVISWAVPTSSGTASQDTFTWTTFDYTGSLSIAIKPAAAPTVVNGVLISNGHPVKSGSSILYK